jgi:hypothetical protein
MIPFLRIPISLVFEFPNAFFHSSKFLLQLIPVVLQAFLFLPGGKEATE